MLDRSPLPLSNRLAAAIPSGVDFCCFHVSTKPAPSSALFSPIPSQPEEPTTCESHFLAISTPEDGDKKQLLIYAVEILIFATSSLTFIFVSKADSSGFSSYLHSPKNAPSVISTVTSTFIDFLLESRLHSSRVVVSLFARAQNQYLFPGSIDNHGKHVLNDRQLIKWWTRVLDRTLRHHDHDADPNVKATAHLVVPGCDYGETKAFFPSSSKLDLATNPKWFNLYPVELLVTDASQPPRFVLPRLPDDPKARFLDDLDNDFTNDQGQWRSVRSLRDFWEMMSYRQECSAGRLVGFVWIGFTRGQPDGEKSCQTTNLAAPQLTTPDCSQLQDNTVAEAPHVLEQHVSMAAALDSPPSSSPIPNLRRDTHSEQKDDLHEQSLVDSAITKHCSIDRDLGDSTEGQIVIDSDQYEQLMDFLLQTDFTGEDLAASSTRDWINKVLEISKASAFGYSIRGGLVLTDTQQAMAGSDIPVSQTINVLTNIRKKRKVEQAGAESEAAMGRQESLQDTVNALPAALVRKKPKT